MNNNFTIIVETGQGRAAYPATGLEDAFAIYREQFETYQDCQVHLMRDMPSVTAAVNAAGRGGIAEAVERAHDSRKIEKHKQIDSKYLKQQTEGADPSNPLYKKVVVMSGTFGLIKMERNEVAAALQALGAKVNRSVSNTIQVFVQGDRAGDSKVNGVKALRASGRDVRIITPVELKEIIDKYI